MGDGFVTFTALRNRSSIGLVRLSGEKGTLLVSGGRHKLEYSTDGTNWTNMTTEMTIGLNSGDSVYIRGTITPTGGSKDFNKGSLYTQFKMSGKIAASGNCNALWDYINATSNTTIEIGKDWGYNLFCDCAALTTAPELPSTKLAEGCYFNMFYGCTALTKAPELPATTLVEMCYHDMFNGCSSLNYIKCLATDISAAYCTDNWVKNVSQTGTFVRSNTMSNWEIGVDGIPYGWIESDKPIKYEDIANELLNTIPIESVPYQFLYQTYLSEYLDMGYNSDAYDTVYELILQYSPNVIANVETFNVINDENKKIISLKNNGNLYIKGNNTITGKITATNAKSHNLVYFNELNLVDLTNGNTLYLNYRNSTNPINEYKFCKGVGNQSTYSDIRCGTLYQTSDITKKNVISDLDLDKAYDLIDKCQTIIYTLKDDERNKEQIGVIAQEIQEFFPEVVSADENGILALDYSRLTVIIMKVLKDVIKRVQRLEEKK